MDIEYAKTCRLFQILEFTDLYGELCTIQESSLATEPAIWLGVRAPTPKILGRLVREEITGWVDYPLPGDVQITSRMHLSQEQVKALLPILQHFVETGKLPERESGQ